MAVVALFAAGSNELMPLVVGPYCRSKERPCWPWLLGSLREPRGCQCRICSLTFLLADFAKQYPDGMDGLINDINDEKKVPIMTRMVMARISVNVLCRFVV